MKSQVHTVTTVALAILQDIRAAYPHLGDLSRDIDRLSRLSIERGLGFYTLDLPNLDDLLIEGLEIGSLSLRGPCSARVSAKTRVPKFLSGLWLLVFHRDGTLRTDFDVNAIYFLRQVFVLGKKITVGCSSNRLLSTVGEYHEIERTTRSPSLDWESDILDFSGLHRRLHFCDGLDDYRSAYKESGLRSDYSKYAKIRVLCERLQRVSGIIACSLGQYDPYEFTQNSYESKRPRSVFKHGPGAVSDQRGKLINKYHFPNWPDKLQAMFPFDAFANFSFSPEGFVSDVEAPSKLIAVPKTAKGPRLIASEPTSHQWCQQITKNYIVSKTETTWLRHFVDFKSQQKSRDMALNSSKSGELATVDLSSASDRLSCWAIERFYSMNNSLLTALHASRTRYIRDDISGRGLLLQKKFASQGTAVTFPVQTIFFLACALAVMPGPAKKVKDLIRYKGMVRVFGDDIILPKTGYADLRILLEYLGLKINEKKSFHQGPFRESCGMDAVGGYDITPLRPTILRSDTPTSLIAALDTANNFHKKGLWHAAAAIESTLLNRRMYCLPIVGPGCGVVGRFSFCGNEVSHLKSRWNPYLQRREFRSWGVISKSKVIPANDMTGITQYLSEMPRPDDLWKAGQRSIPKDREVFRWVEPYDLIVSSVRN